MPCLELHGATGLPELLALTLERLHVLVLRCQGGVGLGARDLQSGAGIPCGRVPRALPRPGEDSAHFFILGVRERVEPQGPADSYGPTSRRTSNQTQPGRVNVFHRQMQTLGDERRDLV